jgi:hypothetical protein
MAHLNGIPVRVERTVAVTGNGAAQTDATTPEDRVPAQV